MGRIVPEVPIDEFTLSRNDEDTNYYYHDNGDDQIVDASAFLRDPVYGYYKSIDPRIYPTMTQGPWVIADPVAEAKDELGFTHPNLHRRLDAKMPDDEEEILPREYVVDLMNVNSYRTTKYRTHVDYQDLDKYIEENPDSPYMDELKRRSELGEEREIP